MTIYLSDFRRFGFQRSAIVPFLKEHGIDIEDALETIRAEGARAMQAAGEAAPVTPTAPDWRQLAWNWKPWTPYECAIAICGDNPISDYGINGYQDNSDVHSTWQHTIQCACEKGVLPCAKGTDRYGNDNFLVAPPELYQWCQSNGYSCPLIPSGEPLPSNHAALAARCLEAERQRDGQRARAEKAEAQRDALNTQGAAAQNRAMLANAKETDPAWKMLESAMRAETARLDALRKQLEGANTVAASNVRWPWGEYTTPALEVLATMAQRYVTNGTCDAKAEAIKADVQTAGMSERIAEGISQMLRADSESNRKLAPKKAR